MPLRFSRSALNTIATDLSQLSDPAIPELTLHDDKTLQNKMLAGVLGAFSGEGNAHARYLMTNVVRRVHAAIETCKLGRRHAYDYVGGDRFNRLDLYFMSLTNFESCIAYSWQVANLARLMAKVNVYEPGDGSAWERLHDIYTIGTKHSFREPEPDSPPASPTTVWLTNEGIASMESAFISFQELAEAIDANNDLFCLVQDRALEKRRRSS